MGMWDRSKLLGGTRMGDAYEAGTPFILYGMRSGGTLGPELTGGDNPADKTVLLTQEATRDGGVYVAIPGTEQVVDTLSGPIAGMLAEAEPEDFPAVVAWESVSTKTRDKATVLNYLGAFDGPSEPDSVPPEWGTY